MECTQPTGDQLQTLQNITEEMYTYLRSCGLIIFDNKLSSEWPTLARQ